MVFLIYWLYERLENWHFKRKNTDLGAFFSLYIIKNRIISSVVLWVSVWLQRKLKIGNLLGDRRSLHGWVHLMNGAPKEKMYFGSLYPSTLLKSCCVLPNPNILALHDWPLKMFSLKVFTNFQFWVCGFSLRLNLHDFFFLNMLDLKAEKEKKLCAISSGARGRNWPLRKASALQNFAIIWNCNIKNLE